MTGAETAPAAAPPPAAAAARESPEELVQIFPQHNVLLGLPPALTITVCGGGHGAHTAAAFLGSKPGLCVNVLTRQPARWRRCLTIGTANTSWEKKGEIRGLVNMATDDASAVVPQSDIVLVLSPAHTHRPILERVAPHLRAGAILGSLYCQGGFEWVARRCLTDAGTADSIDGFFGLLNIPWITNAPEYGARIRLIGPKKVLRLAAHPAKAAPHYCALVAALFDIPCTPLPNFTCLLLTPSNQIIHPARYYAIFKDWDGKKVYSEDEVQWGLYNQFDDLAAEKLQLLDDELQSVKKALEARFPQIDLAPVLPIGERIVAQYGADVADRSSLRMIFNSNKGYAGCVTPTNKVGENKFQPKVDSRLFWEDIPFGLCILKSLAAMAKVPTPEMDFMIRWHQQFMGVEFLLPDGRLNPAVLDQTGCPGAFGFTTLEQAVSQ